MTHYTTHQGRLHHHSHGPDLEEQVCHDFSYFVATGPRAFEDGEIVAAARSKHGVVRVMLKRGETCLTIYSRDEFLPQGIEVSHEP